MIVLIIEICWITWEVFGSKWVFVICIVFCICEFTFPFGFNGFITKAYDGDVCWIELINLKLLLT